MELYKKLLEKYNIKESNTRCIEFLEILNKFEFYEKRAVWYLKPIYKILRFFTEFLIRKR